MVSYEEAKQIVLARLRQWIENLPVAERTMPRLVVRMRPYSPLDILREVEMDTEIGREYVYSQAKALGYTIE